MPGENEEVIIQSIKKLLSLKLTDDEIIENLLDAGLEEDYARDILASIKKEKEVSKEKTAPTKTKVPTSKDDNVWDEGVLSVINQKLEEISEKERNIGQAIKKETQVIVEKELEKIKVVLDSQRILLVNKVNSAVSDTTAGANKKIEDSLKEIVEFEERINKKSDELLMNYKLLKELQDSISKQVEEFPRLKEELFAKFEKDASKYQNNYDALLEKYDEKFKDIDNKLNNTMSLATKIVEGLVETGKKKIDDIAKSKNKEEVSGISDKIKEFEVTKSKMIKEIAKIEEIREEYEKKRGEDIKQAVKMYLDQNMAGILKSAKQKEDTEGQEVFKEQIGNLVKKLQRDVEELKSPKKVAPKAKVTKK
ncbi:MAG: hypothetical protein PHH82_04115 [Candidatus ainarchaeum sp.]|nr:hypothetical protein [Candidatus ainarchaeum sp.]